MAQRVAITVTAIAPGAKVRLKKEHAPSLKDLMARWEVVNCDEEFASVVDVEDDEDRRTFSIDEIERIAGGAEKVVGYTLVKNQDTYPEIRRSEPSPEYPSLFDDPEALLDEDEDDE